MNGATPYQSTPDLGQIHQDQTDVISAPPIQRGGKKLFSGQRQLRFQGAALQLRLIKLTVESVTAQ